MKYILYLFNTLSSEIIMLLEFELNVSEEEEVLKQLHDENANERVRDVVRRGLEEGKELIDAKAVVEEFAISDRGEEFVEIGDSGLRIESKNVAALLKDCEKVSLFACTVSSDFKVEGEALQGLVFDAIGSVAVEKLAERVNEKVGERAEGEGFRVTQRYSCGFADWGLSDQRKILELLHGEEIGLKVNEANILIPRKSITALIGWFK